MTDPIGAPLVTFALIAYNQEKYIKEAVEAALAQDYTPLEVIISDDFSSDHTFDVITEVVSEYQGPHRVYINRNNSNLGIGGHVGAVLKLSKGAWVVMAAGDDVSLPARVRKTIDCARDFTPPVDCVAVAMDNVDEEGCRTGGVRNMPIHREDLTAASLAGAGLAYSRRVIDDFGELSKAVQNEDVVLLARALMLSGVAFVPQSMVLYRSHSANRSKKNTRLADFNNDWLESSLRNARRGAAMANQVWLDADQKDSARVPYFNELMLLRRKAKVVESLVELGIPPSLSDGLFLLLHADLIKAWIGVFLAKKINPKFGRAGSDK